MATVGIFAFFAKIIISASKNVNPGVAVRIKDGLYFFIYSSNCFDLFVKIFSRNVKTDGSVNFIGKKREIILNITLLSSVDLFLR